MSIFADRRNALVVQGITGRDGSIHTRQMVEYARTSSPASRRGRAG
jgi:succinyl-CoA synthetase alpha subunit